MSDDARRILVIRFSSLGDVVLAGAVLRAMGRQNRGTRVVLATKLAYEPLFASVDYSLDVVAFRPGESLFAYWRRLRTIPYDAIVDLHGSLRSIVLAGALRARIKTHVTKNASRRRAMVKRKAGLDEPLSVIETYFSAVRPLGMCPDNQYPRLFLSDLERHRADALRQTTPECIGIGWGARWPTKAVPMEIWSKLLEQLAGHGDIHVRVFGLESDRDAIHRFLEEQAGKQPAVRASIECGLTLREAMVRIASCAVFVSSDSGLMHVAAALGIPTFGLFGPTHPALGFAPQGPGARVFHAGTWCSPCHRHGAAPCVRDRRYCFDELDMSAVADAIHEVFSRQRSATSAD